MNNLEQYNELAHTWWAPISPFAALKRLNEPRMKFFARFVSSWAQKEVCDVGCGGGYLAECLAELGAKVAGVDISDNSLAAAVTHASKMGLNINYQRGCATALPFADSSFDVVVCVDVLEHLQQVPLALQQAFRVLRPGGLFLFDTINRNALSSYVMVTLLEKLLKAIPPGTHDPSMFIKPKEITLLCQEAGFLTPHLVGFSPRSFDFSSRSFGLAVGGPLWIMYAGAAKKPLD